MVFVAYLYAMLGFKVWGLNDVDGSFGVTEPV